MSIAFERVERNISRPPFVVDQSSLVRDTGRQIDWTVVDDEDYVGDLGKHIPAGTVVDLAANGKVVPTKEATGGLTAYGILETNADEHSANDADSGYGVLVGGHFYANLLPDAEGDPAVLAGGTLTELRARGGAWVFMQYEDDTQ